MIVASALVALFALWLSGALLLALARVRDTRTAAGIVADFVAGAALLGFVGSTSLALGLRISLLTIYVPLLMLPVAAWMRRPNLRVSIQLPSDHAARILLVLAGSVLTVLVILALHDRLWWDGWAIWAFKARVLFVSGTLPAAFMEPGGIYSATNLDYPLAVPLLDWWLYRHAGIDDPGLASFAGAIWLSLLALLVWGGLSERGSLRLAAAAALGVSLFWPLSSYAVGGTADVVVALALLGVVVELNRALRGRDRTAIGRVTAYLALGILAKNEGLALAILTVMIALPVLWFSGQRNVRWLVPMALPFLLFLPWYLFTRQGGLVSNAVAGQAETGWLPIRAAVMKKASVTLLQDPVWLPIAPLVLLGIAVAVGRRAAAELAGWTLWLAYLAMVVFIFLRSNADIVWLLGSAYARVLAATVPTAVYLSVRSLTLPSREPIR